MPQHLPSSDFFGFYRQCLNPATDRLAVPTESIAIGVCTDHREGQRLILGQHFGDKVNVAENAWPWREDRCAAVGFVSVGPSRLGDGTLSCPNRHTGPFYLAAHAAAEFYEVDRVGHGIITVGDAAGGADASLDGSEFLTCRPCGRAFSVPQDTYING